jgi:hypothetical protein
VRIEHVEYLLPEYLNGALAASRRPGVEEHLKYCSSCRTELMELRQTMEMLEARGTVEPPGGYFATILPRLRDRLEREEPRNVFASPLLTRLLLPIGAAVLALFILLSIPFPGTESETATNPLQDVMHGSTTGELVDVALDMMPLHPLSSPTLDEETSSLLGVRLLRGEHLLVNVNDASVADGFTQDESMAEELDLLNESDLEVLVQRLGERTTL